MLTHTHTHTPTYTHTHPHRWVLESCFLWSGWDSLTKSFAMPLDAARIDVAQVVYEALSYQFMRPEATSV